MENNATRLSEKDFDNLLGRAFLDLDLEEPKNQKMIEAIANYSLAGAGGWSVLKKASLNKFLLVLAGLSVVTTVLFFQKGNNNDPENKNSVPVITKTKKIDSALVQKEKATLIEDQKAGKPFIDKELPLIIEDIITPAGETLEAEPEELITYEPVLIEKIQETKQPYVFPVLNEKEIKATEKEKKKMIRQALKLNKEKYAFIPGKKFYMQTAEVTNLEYRTFLFDLLAQDKKEDFLKAKPDQSLWLNANGTDKFNANKDLYFSDKRFKDYPVVNITAEGAELYCKWLSELVMSSIKQNDAKSKKYEFRLPAESEWVYGAKAGKESATYPWGRDSIQNNKNRFLANFCIQKMKDKFNQPIVYPSKINPNAYTAGGMATSFDTLATVLVYAYNPNDFYLYCMSGNVSEMVYIDGSKKVKTKGGNWGSDFEHLKIDSEDEFKNAMRASPYIGFRPVIYFEEK